MNLFAGNFFVMVMALLILLAERVMCLNLALLLFLNLITMKSENLIEVWDVFQ